MQKPVKASSRRKVGKVDIKRVEAASREMIKAMGYDLSDPKNEDLIETPARVARMWRELLEPEDFKVTKFEPGDYDEMVVQSGIEYYTFCRHHLLPFFGHVAIGYIPDGKIVGISKLARTVEFFSHSLQTQEYMTVQIGRFLEDTLCPKGVAVVVTGVHLCEGMRGVRHPEALTTTSFISGNFKKKKVKSEFYRLAEIKKGTS